jgi:NADH dehydrogenase
VGDLASAINPATGQQVPGVAQGAMQMGTHAARIIAREASRSAAQAPGARPTFHYHDKGMLATIGRASGVARFRHLKLWGFPAWVAWLVVHIFFLIGFRNRLRVMLEWAYAYITYDRGARLITGEFDRLRLLADHPADDRMDEPAAGGPRG